MGKSSEQVIENNEMEQANLPEKKVLTVSDIRAFLTDMVESVVNGEIDAIEAFYKFKSIEKTLASIKPQLDSEALLLAESYGEKNFIHHDLEVTFKSGSKTYSFKEIPEYARMTEEMKSKQALWKAAYSAWEKGSSMFDEDSGEQIPIPVVTNGKDSMMIKLATR